MRLDELGLDFLLRSPSSVFPCIKKDATLKGLASCIAGKKTLGTFVLQVMLDIRIAQDSLHNCLLNGT